jgi:hypothetical protein
MVRVKRRRVPIACPTYQLTCGPKQPPPRGDPACLNAGFFFVIGHSHLLWLGLTDCSDHVCDGDEGFVGLRTMGTGSPGPASPTCFRAHMVPRSRRFKVRRGAWPRSFFLRNRGLNRCGLRTHVYLEAGQRTAHHSIL